MASVPPLRCFGSKFFEHFCFGFYDETVMDVAYVLLARRGSSSCFMLCMIFAEILPFGSMRGSTLTAPRWRQFQNESRNVCLFVHSRILQYLLNEKARGNDDVSN